MSIYRKLAKQFEPSSLLSQSEASAITEAKREKSSQGRNISNPEDFWEKEVQPRILTRAKQGCNNTFVKNLTPASCEMLISLGKTLGYKCEIDFDGDFAIEW